VEFLKAVVVEKNLKYALADFKKSKAIGIFRPDLSDILKDIEIRLKGSTAQGNPKLNHYYG